MTRRAVLFSLLAAAGCRPTPQNLRVTFLDVGQGDATVIEAPSGRVVVIDGGGHPGTDERLGGDPGARVVVPYLRSRGINRVDLLVPTHPDDDHVQGLIAVVNQLSVQSVLDAGFPAPTGPCARLRSAVAARKIPTQRAVRGQSIELGAGAVLDILHPAATFLAKTHSDSNNNAIVLRLRYGVTRFLLMADAETEAEAALLNAEPELRADVLKVGHHGSRGSSGEALLARVQPQIAVISCGQNNSFGHPHPEALARLRATRATLYRTDTQGAITVESDGRTLKVTPTIEKPPASAGG